MPHSETHCRRGEKRLLRTFWQQADATRHETSHTTHTPTRPLSTHTQPGQSAAANGIVQAVCIEFDACVLETLITAIYTPQGRATSDPNHCNNVVENDCKAMANGPSTNKRAHEDRGRGHAADPPGLTASAGPFVHTPSRPGDWPSLHWHALLPGSVILFWPHS